MGDKDQALRPEDPHGERLGRTKRDWNRRRGGRMDLEGRWLQCPRYPPSKLNDAAVLPPSLIFSFFSSAHFSICFMQNKVFGSFHFYISFYSSLENY